MIRQRSSEETAALVAVHRLQAAYGDAVSRRAWDDVASLFTPDAVVDIDVRDPSRPPIHLDGPAAIVDFVARALEQFAFFEFVLLNAVADVQGDGATGRVHLCEIRHGHDDVWSQAFGLYQDRYRRRDGGWSIAARRYSSLARRGPAAGSFAMPELDHWPGWLG